MLLYVSDIWFEVSSLQCPISLEFTLTYMLFFVIVERCYARRDDEC